ncbi:MAG: bifunctional oligoribonuclease/PAP phosphatase NrnA [Clostridia bacterium]|nr:bifunctional oligoribonuclease/PAP phosphatase NrnA [Clostridia bacterium]
MFEAILTAIRAFPRIIIHRHQKPDGDAIGSQVGLSEILKANFPEKEVYIVGDAPGRYGFIENSTPDTVSDEAYQDALAIVLDTSAKALISDTRYQTAKATARIDHHIFVETICEHEVTDTSFESCCGLIVALAIESGLVIPTVAATALYTGMVTDSGRFRYDSTTSQTHRLAARLLEEKVDTAEIYRNLYADDLERNKLRARFVLKINVTEDGVAYLYTTKEELQALDVDIFTVSRGMVGTMADLKGIDIWVNFTETEEGVLCELRSSRYNINPIAVKYGGGGHAKASGATVKNCEEAMAMLDDLNHMIEH